MIDMIFSYLRTPMTMIVLDMSSPVLEDQLSRSRSPITVEMEDVSSTVRQDIYLVSTLEEVL